VGLVYENPSLIYGNNFISIFWVEFFFSLFEKVGAWNLKQNGLEPKP